MKKAAHALAKASFIVTIVLTVLYGLASMAYFLGGMQNTSYIVMGSAYLCFAVSCALGIYFSKALLTKLETAKEKGEIVGMAVCVIIFGFIPAGIIALCVPEDQFSGYVAPEASLEAGGGETPSESTDEEPKEKDETIVDVEVVDTNGNDRGAA